MPVPKYPAGEPAPSDPRECATKIKDYRTTDRNKMTDADWKTVNDGYNKAMNVYCKP